MSKLKWHVILAFALMAVFCGMAAAEQFYVNEGGWWREGGVVNISYTPIQAAVGAADAGDMIAMWNCSRDENMTTELLSLSKLAP